jgi:hypothetical protein
MWWVKRWLLLFVMGCVCTEGRELTRLARGSAVEWTAHGQHHHSRDNSIIKVASDLER